MSLTLSVLTYRNQPPPRAMSKRFSAGGGSIGRQDQNDLVLPDPEKLISRVHARIEFRDSVYFITRLGQNPVDLNGRALAAGASEPLSAGDRLTIGDYCLLADVEAAAAAQFSRPQNDGFLPSDDLLGGLDTPPGAQSGSGSAFGISLMGAESSSPSSLGHSSEQAPEQLPTSRDGLQRDQVPGHREHFSTRMRVPASPIPEDYDLLKDAEAEADATLPPVAKPSPAVLERDPFAEPIPVDTGHRSQRASSTPEIPQPGPLRGIAGGNPMPSAGNTPSAAPRPSSPSDEYASAVRTLLEAAGVPDLEERALADPEFMRTVGELLREAVAGLLKALVARALTKRELRVDMTILAATENNPLKFSPDAYEALSHLLVKRQRSGYLPPVRALQDAYDDLQAHNLAVISGMRAALMEVLQRFEPARLEQRMKSDSMLEKLVPAHRKARLWDLAAEQHAELLREAQDDFDRIFGRAFRSAYEEQIQKIRRASGKPRPP